MNFKTSLVNLVLAMCVASCSSNTRNTFYQEREGFDEFDEEVILGPKSEALSLEDFLEQEESAEDQALYGDEENDETEDDAVPIPIKPVTPKRDLRFEINKAIASHRPEFKYCYDQHGEKATGQIIMVFRIRSDGKVQRAGIVTSELPIGLKACLVEKIYQIEFPKFRSGKNIDIKQPLNF
jgi:hypothetical protein